MPDKAKILSVQEVNSLSPARAGKKDVLALVQIPGQPIRSVTVPAETATKDTIAAASREDLKKYAALTGLEFDV